MCISIFLTPLMEQVKFEFFIPEEISSSKVWSNLGNSGLKKLVVEVNYDSDNIEMNKIFLGHCSEELDSVKGDRKKFVEPLLMMNEQETKRDGDNCLNNCNPESLVKKEEIDADGNVQTKKYHCQFSDRSKIKQERLAELIDTINSEIGNLESVHSKAKKQEYSKCDSSCECASERMDASNTFQCSHCDFLASQKDHLKKHMWSMHLKLKKYKCSLCNYSANTNCDLKNHVNAIHLDTNKYKCTDCDYSTGWKQVLRKHMNTSHSELREEYKCALCDYSANQRSNLKRHMDDVHLKIKKYNCSKCDYSASQNSTLRIHINAVHLKFKQHKCSQCDYATTKGTILQAHVDAIHLKLKKHKCSQCDYSTTRKSLLENHIDSVHLNLKYECPLCDYSASQKAHINHHMGAIHLKVKKYKCSWCDHSTAAKSDLKRHINAVHLISQNYNCLDTCSQVAQKRFF